MTAILERIFGFLDQKSPAHAARVRRAMELEGTADFSKASEFIERYDLYIRKRGKTIEYGVDCYLKLNAHMVHERIAFLRSGRYANTSFADVESQIYLNPEVFEYHMHGLVFAQFFWPDQFARFKFFSKYIQEYLANGETYLEVGGGHALYILEAMNRAPRSSEFQMVDISPSSMDLAQGLAGNAQIDFRLMNIFDYPVDKKFSFITMGEVIEHVEDPLSLLKQVQGLLAPGGTAFISTPANAPTIDHIYLFNSADEIRAMLSAAGFKILREAVCFGQNVDEERARSLKVAVMFAAFVGKSVE